MDFELIWWLTMFICSMAFALLGPDIFNLIQNRYDQYVEDLPAWTRNYARIQRRH